VGLRSWLARRRDSEIDEEIESHLQMAIRDRIERGEEPRDARRRALVEFGSATLAKEETRSVWTWIRLEQLAADLQIGARILWRAPALSAAAVALIALVIGGNTTIFSMVHAVLAKPAPGVAADRLVTIGWVTDGEEHPGGSYPHYAQVAAASQTVRPMLAFDFQRFILTTADGSYAIQGATVSSNYFDTLAIRPIVGRAFNESEGRLGASVLPRRPTSPAGRRSSTDTWRRSSAWPRRCSAVSCWARDRMCGCRSSRTRRSTSGAARSPIRWRRFS
jgi:putative ABC transport system permease protein